MSVESFGSLTSGSHSVSSSWGTPATPHHHLNSLAMALQSGNVSAAQSASAAIAEAAISANVVVTGSLMALEAALDDGDLAAAQQAFLALKHSINPESQGETRGAVEHIDARA